MTTKVTVKNESNGETGGKVAIYFVNPPVEGAEAELVLIGTLLPEQSHEFHLHGGQRVLLDEAE
jgi:hypothetical protein